MARGQSSRQTEFDLDAFDRDRSEFINGVRVVMERVMDASRMGPTELQLRELVMVCARLGSLRDLKKLAMVDWSLADWSRELRAKKTLIYKCLAVAKAAGILEGQIGELTLNRHGLRLWLLGELPTVEMRASIDKAKESKSAKSKVSDAPIPSREPPPDSVSRTDQFASRNADSVSRNRTSLSYFSNTDPDPVPESIPPDGMPSAGRTDRPLPVSDSEAGPVFLDDLPEYVLQQPEIAAAVRLPVDPLPPGDLIRGVFTVLSVSDLGSSKAMTLWFRRQLSAPDPVVTGSTEAHLLVVIACGIYATRMPDHAVRRTRVGVFVTTLRRRELRRVLKFLPIAQELLSELKQAVGEQCTRIAREAATR